jgi:Glycosyl hydrolase family 26
MPTYDDPPDPYATNELPLVRPRLWRRVGIAAAVAVVVLGTAAWATMAASGKQHAGTDGTYALPAASRTAAGTPLPGPGSPSAHPSPSAKPSTSAKPSVTKPVPKSTPPARIPAGSTLCGAAFATAGGQSYMQTFQQEQNLIGPLHAVRVFYPGAPSPWPGNAGNVDRTVIVSFKFLPKDVLAGTEDTAMRTWFADAPRDRDVYWVFYHEPEDQIADGTFTAADYRNAWAHLRALADEAHNPRLHATLVLMQWSVDPASHRDWKDYYPGDNVIDVIGWDVYNLNKNKGTYSSVSSLLDAVEAASNSVNKPWGVAEFGGAKVPSDPDGTARAAWLTSMITAMQKGHALWVSYFDLNWDNGVDDYQLRDPASEAVWHSFCASSG